MNNMKKLRKVLALVLAMVMVLGMSTMTAFAETAGTPQSPTGTITIESPDDTASTTTNIYSIYRIFDATVASDGTTAYKLIYDTAPTGFTAQNGYITNAPTNLDATAIASLAEYVSDNNIPVADTVEITGHNTVASDALTPGYYYITTTSGTAVIVNANQSTTIKDKNELSTVDKVAGSEYDKDSKKAIAAVGTSQPFTVQITKKHGTGHIVFNDTMTNMTYDGSIKVTVNNNEVLESDTTYSVTPAKNNAGLTVTFVDSYIQNLADNTIITLNYSATITSDALQVNPATNKASLTLDNGNTTTSTDVEVYNARITVNKVDETNQPLAGAKFKLKNSDGKYYAGANTDGTANWNTTGIEVDAVAVTNDDNTVISYTANFTGLAAGRYTLIESTVPAGYNKADDKPITISDTDFDNLVITQTIENKKGATLPSTGGMGTTLFYVFGAVLVIGAGIVLVTRRRMAK